MVSWRRAGGALQLPYALFDEDGAAARLPWASVHDTDITMPEDVVVERMSHLALAMTSGRGPGDIDVGKLNRTDLASIGCDAPALMDAVAVALSALPLPGIARRARLSTKSGEPNWLTCQGASFHNDTMGHWTSCLFWVLVLDAPDAELVVPALDMRLALPRGRLVVFDPCVPHGLCRPADGGQWLRESFEDSERSYQSFIAGELNLPCRSWADIGLGKRSANSPVMRSRIDLCGASICVQTGRVLGAARPIPDAIAA